MRWNRFLVAYKDRLVGAGIPEITFRSESNWYYFIDHEYDFEYPELLDLSKWEPVELRRLLPIFEEMSHDGEYVGSILNILKARTEAS